MPSREHQVILERIVRQTAEVLAAGSLLAQCPRTLWRLARDARNLLRQSLSTLFLQNAS